MIINTGRDEDFVTVFTVCASYLVFSVKFLCALGGRRSCK